MPLSGTLKHRRSLSNSSNDAMATDETQSILRSRRSSDDGRPSHESDTSVLPEIAAPKPVRPLLLPIRQSSFAKTPGTPRTPNRVRFNFEGGEISEDGANGQVVMSPSIWMELEDPLDSPAYANGNHSGQRLPLLTGIEAPSVTVANYDEDFNAEDLLESARPKSGAVNAFMNMANSIM